MKKPFCIRLVVLVFLLFSAANAMAQTMLVIGEKIASDAQGRAIYQTRVNNISIGYQLIGNGEPLVLIMGLGGTMQQWPTPLIDTLSKHYQLVLLDNRGMGHSTSNDVPFDTRLFADDVIALLNALHIDKASVLGYSMGSTITQELLLSYPQRVNKAIILAGSTNGANVAETFKGRVIPDPVIRRQIEAAALWKTPLDRMAQIKNPLLLIVGTSDKVVGTDSSKTLATTIPGAWLVQYKNGSHGVMRELPEAVSQVVLTFLQTEQTVPLK